MTVWLFHGFLGRGSDWDPLIEAVGPRTLCLAPDLFHRESQPVESFQAWGERFYEDVLSQVDGPFVGVGYSLGGRLLMHLATQYPFLWRDVFLLSSSTGWFLSDEQKSERRKWDEDWSDRFLYGDWEEIVADWNDQEILQGPIRWERAQKDFDRAKLSRALRLWSPTRHTFGRDDFLNVPFQVHHWVGEDDAKYKQEQLALLTSGLTWDFQVLAGGHRFPFEHPGMISKVLAPYLDEPICPPADEAL
jgi:pimeloyl-ACP methyl ester carboxylesterase